MDDRRSVLHQFCRQLKKTAARTKDDLWEAIGRGIDTFTPAECENYFAAAGYDRA